MEGYSGPTCSEKDVAEESSTILIVTLSVIGGVLVIIGAMVATLLWKSRRPRYVIKMGRTFVQYIAIFIM